MSRKEKLLRKLFGIPFPKNFTIGELDTLMNQCGCEKTPGGRGSAISYYHIETKRILRFDGPHPGNELYIYQIKLVRKFLEEIGESEAN